MIGNWVTQVAVAFILILLITMRNLIGASQWGSPWIRHAIEIIIIPFAFFFLLDIFFIIQGLI